MSKEDFITETTIPNDKIDIYGDIKVKSKKIKSNEDVFHMIIEGYNIDNSVINGIRRTILTDIPIYGFHRSNIFIDVEKSYNMYNNDLIFQQIETLPIFDIPNFFDLEDPEIYLPNDIMKQIFGTFIPDKYEKEEKKEEKKLFDIEISINIKNLEDKYLFVSTHHIILKIDGKTSNSYKNRKPISILVLKPGESLTLRAIANLGIAKINGIYEATTNAIHREITPMKYELEYETLGQLNKDIIFKKANTIIKKKLKNLKRYIKEKYEERDKKEIIEIQLFGEDHTIGNLITTILQKSEFTEKAAYSMPHILVNQIKILYKIKETSKIGPIKVLIDCLTYLIKLFDNILKL